MFKKIMVTGGGGVAGHGIQAIQGEYPSSEFYFPSSKDCDLTDRVATLAYVKKLKPDAIIHLAAKSGGIGLSMKYPATLLRDNVLMIFSVLDAAREVGVKKVVMTLSTGMYPAEAPLPLREESMHNGVPHQTANSYAFAKRLVDPAIGSYRREYGMNVIGLIPNGIFGPNDNFNPETASMLPSLIRRFYLGREAKEPLVVWGDGTPLREYTFSQDIARAFMWCLEKYDGEQVLNVGSTEEHSIKEIAEAIAENFGIERSRIQFDTTKPNGAMRRNTDNSKFVALSGFEYTPFRDGLKRTVEWFREESCRGNQIKDKAKN